MTNKPTNSHTLLGIEFLRFLAALAVLISHYPVFTVVGYTYSPEYLITNQPFYSAMRWLYKYGHFGVQVFWCISGFIFTWKYAHLIAQRHVTAKTFFLLRVSRLYPLHFVMLLLTALLQILYFKDNGRFFVNKYNDATHFLLQLFMASNWGPQNSPWGPWNKGPLRGYSFDGPIWSISLEVLVYLVFFVLLYWFRHRKVIYIFVAQVWIIAKIIGIQHSFFDCLFCFYLGGATAALFDCSPKLQRILFFIFLGFIASAAGYAWSIQFYRSSNLTLLLLMTVLPALMYVTTYVRQPEGEWACIIQTLGNMTYASYLLHFPLQLLIVLIVSYGHIAPPFYNGWFFLFFNGLVGVLSVLIYRFFERPAQAALRAKFL